VDKLEQLAADLKATDARLDILLAADALTDDERAEHDLLVEERGRVKGKIDQERQRLLREQEREALEAEALALRQTRTERARRLAAAGAGRVTDADMPPPGDVPGDRRRATLTVPAGVRRVATPKNFRGTRHGLDAEARAFAFGQWCLARMSEDLPSRFQFKGAQEWVRKNMAAVTSADGSGYQYLIPEQFGDDLIDLREQYGVARKLFKIVPMSSDTRTDPRRAGGLTAYPTAEGQPGTESSKVWNQIRLTAKDIMVLSRYTNQVAADAVISVGDDLAGEVAYAFSQFEDNCAFNGDGSGTFAGITGVRTALTTGTKAGKVPAAVLGAWSSITLKDLQAVVAKLPQFADTDDCTWVCHRAFYFGVMQVLELAAGGTTIRELATGERRPRPLFLGYPVTISQIWPGTTAASQLCVVLGNFTQGASFGDRQQDSIAFSEHATVGGESVFERNQMAIRGTERFDINVHDVGDAVNAGPIVGLTT